MTSLILIIGFLMVMLPARAQPTVDELSQRTIHRRAVEAVIWGMPAVNYDLMLQAAIGAGGKGLNQVVYWSRLPDWKNQTLTPNPDVIYLMPFFDTKDVGPMVMEIPPAGPDGSITGSIDDAWQTALEDVGPAGVDKGKGGKYLILPPGYKDKAPEGYIALQSPTYPQLRPAALQSRERQRSRCRQGGRLRQAREGLSAVAGRQSAADHVRRRDRRRIRQHHSLRPALLPGARPLRAARAVDRARPGDDRHAEVGRHREGKEVRSRSGRRRPF